MRRLPFFFLPMLLLAAGPAPAQGPTAWNRLAPPRADTSVAAPLPPPSAPAVVRRPAAARLRELRGQHDLQYVEVREEPAQASFWQRLLRWLWRQLTPAMSSQGGKKAWDVFFYGLMAAALVFAVLKLLQVDITRAFGRAPRGLPLAYEVGQENIHELNFGEAIAQAEAAGNRRLALRLGYLQLLKQLTDRDFISWQPDKTNQTYLRELAASYPAGRLAFAELTRQFDYSWYGELPLSADLYQQARAAQQQLAQQLAAAAPGRAQPA
ncbi:DUF4129 domain-containing protein [Hymenobacter sp. UV11]|uniref:DUF4129 domain-containing protein n=1 Tax=Hymenobacter sp. UV11 TaxID=1849735 RepID=UPI00105D9755|nr:DUF4129 domain-containing protein [Hymenobacter sp. UV11]TDN37503.1 hypothetical protein A8B98_02945 [Hymenobacter sp. UV11]TFZ68696.1 DUF4129 domain-containing protein [Hymenobacter sp. UV11]